MAEKILKLNEEEADCLSSEFRKVVALLSVMNYAHDSGCEIPKGHMTEVLEIAQDSVKKIGNIIEPVFP